MLDTSSRISLLAVNNVISVYTLAVDSLKLPVLMKPYLSYFLPFFFSTTQILACTLRLGKPKTNLMPFSSNNFAYFMLAFSSNLAWSSI